MEANIKEIETIINQLKKTDMSQFIDLSINTTGIKNTRVGA